MEEFLKNKLKEALIQPKALLSRARLTDTSSWDKGSISDPRYLPFYYYLSSQLKCEKVLEYGYGLGLTAACFCQGNSGIKKYYGFQKTNNEFYYSFRLGLASLKEYYKGHVKLASGGTPEFKRLLEADKWDVVLITQKIEQKFLKDHLELIWANINPDALIVMDNLSEDDYSTVFMEWCSTKNRVPTLYETRYTVGILVR